MQASKQAFDDDDDDDDENDEQAIFIIKGECIYIDVYSEPADSTPSLIINVYIHTTYQLVV